MKSLTIFIFFMMISTVASAGQTDEAYNHDSGSNTSNTTTIVVRSTDEYIQYSWWQDIRDWFYPPMPQGCYPHPDGSGWTICCLNAAGCRTGP